MRRRTAGWTGLVTLLMGAVLAAAQPDGAAASARVVAADLDHPGGLALHEGTLYVTEAGHGGDRCEGAGDAATCFGATGAVTAVGLDGTGQRRIASGLPSLRAGGGRVRGPADVDFQGDAGALVIGSAGDVRQLRASFGPLAACLGTLQRLAPDGPRRPLADLAGFEAANDPDGAGIDSDPRSVVVADGDAAVADAGANTLLGVDGVGGVGLLARFPAVPLPGGELARAAPTAVVRAADGAFIVGEQRGSPPLSGQAQVDRVAPGGGEPTVLAAGFTAIADVALAPDGGLYVLELASASPEGTGGPGRLVRLAADGVRTEIAAGRLVAPTGLAVGPGGRLYVADGGTAPEHGQVLSINSRMLAEFTYRDRHVEIGETEQGAVLVLDGACRQPLLRSDRGWESALLPFESYPDPVGLAKALLDADGVLFDLCPPGP
jgi:hypothetical protein